MTVIRYESRLPRDFEMNEGYTDCCPNAICIATVAGGVPRDNARRAHWHVVSLFAAMQLASHDRHRFVIRTQIDPALCRLDDSGFFLAVAG